MGMDTIYRSFVNMTHELSIQKFLYLVNGPSLNTNSSLELKSLFAVRSSDQKMSHELKHNCQSNW